MTCSQIRDMLELVLTQKSVEGKLEGVDLTQEGKGSCKRNNERLRENLRWKRYNSYNRAKSHRPKLREIWGLQTARCIIGVSSSPSRASRHLPSSGHQTPQEEEIRQLKRENDLLRQERDILKKSIGLFSRSQV